MRFMRHDEMTEKRERLIKLKVQKIYLTKLHQTFPKYRGRDGHPDIGVI